jgi:hypothetical protein
MDKEIMLGVIRAYVPQGYFVNHHIPRQPKSSWGDPHYIVTHPTGIVAAVLVDKGDNWIVWKHWARTYLDPADPNSLDRLQELLQVLV